MRCLQHDAKPKQYDVVDKESEVGRFESHVDVGPVSLGAIQWFVWFNYLRDAFPERRPLYLSFTMVGKTPS